MSETAASPTPADTPPRYRHFTVAPRTLTLPAEVLLTHVPASVRTGRDPSAPLTVACADILGTNTPRVRSTRLREWLPDSIAIDAELPEWLQLPTAKVALAYRPTSGRELIAAPSSAENSTADPTPPPAPAAEVPRPKGSWKRILKPVLGPSIEELEERRQALLRPQTQTPPPSPQPIAPAVQKQEVPAPSPEPEPPIPAPTDTLPASSTLRAIFHTDEDLTLQRVADLAGSLTGVQGCVLTVGEDLRLSSDIPEGFDVREIRDRLLTLLADAPSDITARGAIRTPALTLYFDQGPISIMRHGSASFLVVHQERSFLPGLREKLSATLEALNN